MYFPTLFSRRQKNPIFGSVVNLSGFLVIYCRTINKVPSLLDFFQLSFNFAINKEFIFHAYEMNRRISRVFVRAKAVAGAKRTHTNAHIQANTHVDVFQSHLNTQNKYTASGSSAWCNWGV